MNAQLRVYSVPILMMFPNAVNIQMKNMPKWNSKPTKMFLHAKLLINIRTRQFNLPRSPTKQSRTNSSYHIWMDEAIFNPSFCWKCKDGPFVTFYGHFHFSIPLSFWSFPNLMMPCIWRHLYVITCPLVATSTTCVPSHLIWIFFLKFSD